MAVEDVPPQATLPLQSASRRGSLLAGRRFASAGDAVFYWATALFASSVLLICLVIAFDLFKTALPSIHKFGFKFLTTSKWDPVADVYGALPFIYGTLVSTIIALILAVPIGLGTAIFLAELAPRWMRTPISFLIEMLAAVPSVIYGLWGVFVLVPFLRPIQTFLGEKYPDFFLFQGPPYGIGMMAGGLILAVMILPFITAVSREVIKAVPPTQREAAFGLGATHWEAISGPVLRYARTGIMGAIILGMARALGETMAVTMVIGNSPTISTSLFSQGYTLASVLANEFSEATTDLYISSLVQVALILFVITIIVNGIARLMLWSMVRNASTLRD